MGVEFKNDLHYLQCSDHTFTRGGMCRQNSDRIGFRVRKLNSGAGQVITTRNIFVSFSSTLWKVIILELGQKMLLIKHVIVYEYVLCISCCYSEGQFITKEARQSNDLVKRFQSWLNFQVVDMMSVGVISSEILANDSLCIIEMLQVTLP